MSTSHHRRPNTLPAEKQRELRKLLRAEPQTSDSEIARRCGVSRYTVARYRREMGLPLPKMGGPKKIPELVRAKVRRLAAEGWSASAIGRQVGLPPRSVRWLLAGAPSHYQPVGAWQPAEEE